MSCKPSRSCAKKPQARRESAEHAAADRNRSQGDRTSILRQPIQMLFMFRSMTRSSSTVTRLDCGQAFIPGGAWAVRIFLSVSDLASVPSLGSAGAGMDGDLIGVTDGFVTVAAVTPFTAMRSMTAMRTSMAITADSHPTDAAIAARAVSRPPDAAHRLPEVLPAIAVPLVPVPALSEEFVAAVKRGAFPLEVDRASVEGRTAVGVHRMAEADTEAAVDAEPTVHLIGHACKSRQKGTDHEIGEKPFEKAVRRHS